MTAPNAPFAYTMIDSSARDPDEPVDTLRTWTVMSNLQHMADSYPHYHVNWMAAAGSTPPFGGVLEQEDIAGVAYLGWVHRFPVSAMALNRGAGIDFRVAACIPGGGTAVCVARVMIDDHPISQNLDASLHGTLWHEGTTFTNTSEDWVIDAAKPLVGIPSLREVDAFDTGVKSRAAYLMVRAEVHIIAADTVQLWGIQLREYPT